MRFVLRKRRVSSRRVRPAESLSRAAQEVTPQPRRSFPGGEKTEWGRDWPCGELSATLREELGVRRAWDPWPAVATRARPRGTQSPHRSRFDSAIVRLTIRFNS